MGSGNDGEVMIQFFAKQNDLMDALVKQQAGFQKSVDSLGKVAEAGNKTGDKLTNAFEKGALSTAKWTAGLIGAENLMGQLISSADKLFDLTDKAAANVGAIGHRFNVQAGLTGIQGDAAKERILAIAEKNAVKHETAGQAAVALASGGFSAEESSGPALDVALKAMQASLKAGEDPTQLMQSAGQFLAAQGMDKNATNLKRVLVASQQLFKTTDFQISDLTQLASKSQGAAGIMSPEQVLGTFNVMRSKTSADVASTGFKIMLERLQTAKGDKESVSALGKLGLKPGDVDLQGEDIHMVLERLGRGLKKLKPEDRPVVMEKLFGKEALSPITGLIRDRGFIRDSVAAMGDTAAFDADVATATSGITPGRVRLEEREQRELAKRDAGLSARLLSAKQINRDSGGSEWGNTVREQVARKTTGALSMMGFEREDAVSMGLTMGFGGGNKFVEKVEEDIRATRAAAEKQTEILERIEKNSAKPAPVVLGPDPAHRAVPAAAAHDRRPR